MTSQQIKDQIESFINQNLESESHFLLEVNIGSGKVREGKVQVLIDSDSGITIEECSKYSRKLGAFLEESDLFEQAYTLEIASPGVDFPLTSERQFLKNINRNLAVEIKGSSTVIEGKLLAYQEDKIQLEVSEKLKGKKSQLKMIEISLENIVKAKVTVSFK